MSGASQPVLYQLLLVLYIVFCTAVLIGVLVSLLPVSLPPGEQLHVAACLAVAIISYAVLESVSLSVSH